MNKRHLIAGAMLLTLAYGRPAHAQDERARAHFEEGRRLARAEQWEAAATEFRASLALELSVGGHLNLADAYARLGKIASAADQFLRAEKLAGPSDAERAREAHARREELAPQIPTVIVTAAPDATATLDGQKVAVGVAVPVDPGVHGVVVVQSSGRRRTIDVIVRRGDHASVVMAREEEAPRLSLDSTVPDQDARRASSASILPTLGWIGLGTGAALLATSGVVYALAVSDKNELEDTCAAYPRCRDDELAAARSLDDGARTKSTIATIGLATGLVFLVAGGVLLLTAPREPRASQVALAISAGRASPGGTAVLRW
jgi:tetratricopeptide (TPR) repeat protein